MSFSGRPLLGTPSSPTDRGSWGWGTCLRRILDTHPFTPVTGPVPWGFPLSRTGVRGMGRGRGVEFPSTVVVEDGRGTV